MVKIELLKLRLRWPMSNDLTKNGDGVSDRARVLLKSLVERHIREGQPVGSKTLQQDAGLPVSSATVRNVMSDLEERGFITSPHTSAGRIPTAQGYRFFVESLLQVRPLDQQSLDSMRMKLNPDLPAAELAQSASSLLSSITDQAGLVIVPKRKMAALRQVEFLPLSDNRVLVILVINEREVQNRIIHTRRAFSEDELKQAAHMVNQRFAGRSLNEVKDAIVSAMEADRASIDGYMQASLDIAASAFESDDNSDQGDFVVAGESHLLGTAAVEEMDKLRGLFDAFQQKKDILHLLERSSQANGVQIFIGEEAGYEVFGDYSIVTAPYETGGQALGVLGVIGPTRMAYERVIPIVDVTAKMLSAALKS